MVVCTGSQRILQPICSAVVCVSVWHVFLHTHSHTHTHTHARTHAHTHTRTHAHTHTRTHVRTHVHTYTHSHFSLNSGFHFTHVWPLMPFTCMKLLHFCLNCQQVLYYGIAGSVKS